MLVAIAVVAIVAIIALYLALINGQGGEPSDTPWVVPFVTGYLILMALALAASLIAQSRLRTALRAGASAGLLVLGVLAAFSIGVAVLVAAGLAIAATVLDLRSKPGARAVASAVTGAVVAVVVLLAGFQVSWTHVVCPPNGESGGTTAGFSVTSYHCLNGVLTFP